MPGGRSKGTVSHRKPKKLKKQHSAGRPRVVINLKTVESLVKFGATELQISEALGVTERSWSRWKRAHPDYHEKKADWRIQAMEDVEKSMFARAKGVTVRKRIFHVDDNGNESLARVETQEVPPDTAAAWKLLCSHKPDTYKDKQEVDTNVKGSLTIVVACQPPNSEPSDD